MQCIVNGKPVILAAGTTLAAFMASKEINPAVVIVEHNQVIVPADKWAGITLQEEDHLEVITFVGGG